MKILLTSALLICSLTCIIGSAIIATTPDPALKGVTFVGPAPWYECRLGNGAFPHEDRCEFFYDCFNSVAWLGLCTDEQLFDLKYNGCNFADQVDCGDRIRPEGYPPGPNTTPAF